MALDPQILLSDKHRSSSAPTMSSQNQAPLDDHSKLASRYWKKYDGFVSSQDLTVADGIRLLSFDYLFKRCHQYHLNYHTFHPNDWSQIQSECPAPETEECVVEFQSFQFG
jgi:hypothetical protein